MIKSLALFWAGAFYFKIFVILRRNEVESKNLN